jgi:hypothetical protein
LVRQRDETLTIYYKAWPVRHRQGVFPKTAFTLDWEAQTLCCPHQVTMPFRPGHTVRFPAETCANCPYWRLARGPGSLPHFMHVGDSAKGDAARTFSRWCENALAILAAQLSPVCYLLQQLLGGV